MMNQSSIIQPKYLERDAYVYLRQSSPGQVRKNKEGKERQLAMRQVVERLGWPSAQITLLDGDTGRSGSTLHGRSDYQTLIDAIRNREAGLVAARELSRLVRDNQDWVYLVRMCQFYDVLLADENRIYNPSDPQDRMVLGIQGAFNEFELSMILDRMQQSLQQKALRGEQYDTVSIGYVCRHESHFEKHPDDRVQRAVAKVFDDFEQFSSVNQLYLKLVDQGFQLPSIPYRREWRDVQWILPSYNQLLNMLKNPVYAGIYVRGRTRVLVSLDAQGHKQKRRCKVPRDQWDVFLEDHHEPYISKDTWERNMKKIASNAGMRGDMTKGAVGRGQSLMAGLLRCGRCGHRLHTKYPSQGVRYYCTGGQRQRHATKNNCLNFRGSELEIALAEEILEVVGPAGVQAAQQASAHVALHYQRQRQVFVDKVDSMRDLESRASREYKQTDVTYSAVRRALGAEWELALDRLAGAEALLKEFDTQTPRTPTPTQLAQLQHLGANVELLWNHPTTTFESKQQIVRLLVEEIVANVDAQRDEVILLVQWKGGHHTELRSARTQRSAKPSAAELPQVIDTLRKVLTDAAMATTLNRHGIQTKGGDPWTATSIKRYRQKMNIPAFNSELKASSEWLTQAEAATRLQISPMSLHRLVRTGILPCEQPQRGLPMVIHAQNLRTPPVERAVKSIQNGQTRPLPENPNQLKLF